MTHSATPSRPRTRRAVLLGVAGLSAALGLSVALFRGAHRSAGRGPLPDPRVAYAGPFRNLAPAVRYVPDGRCADCHPGIARSYAEHPMGRSLLPVAQAASPPADPQHRNPFQSHGSQFRVEHDGDRVRHVRTRLAPDGRIAATTSWDVHYALGSGSRGYSYLTERDGYVFETPVSWYAQNQVWDLYPSARSGDLTARPILPECLACHSNRVHPRDGTLNRYTEPVFDGHAIGCQRCHGPGELHVASRSRQEAVAEPVDYTIVNPAHLEPRLREAVCEQCHLTGESRVAHRGRGLNDFRPGLPVEAFWSVFVRATPAGEGGKAVGHAEQLYQSRCFQAAGGELGCISCHDPHRRVPAAERVAYYRGRCLPCHEQQGCRLPLADRQRTAQDSCIACHMPSYGSSDIPHTASTDHRIPRRRPAPATADRAARPPDDGRFPLVSFYRGRKALDDLEDDRARAVAVVKQALKEDAAALRVLAAVVPELASALRRAPDDLIARESLGYTQGLLGRSAEALAAFQAVLTQSPERETALVGAASMAEAVGQTEAAVGYWRRAVAVDPWPADYHRRLVLSLVKREAWAEAEPACRAWVEADPFSTEARVTRVTCLLAAGRKDEARAEFERVEALGPANLRELQIRFGKKLR
jgi:hypothetical protein